MGSQIHSSDRFTDHYNHSQGGLKFHDENQPFYCNGCKSPGFGPRYRCNLDVCNAELHSCCAQYSLQVTFFMHPHELRFMTRPADGWSVTCNVCTEPISGCFYGCYCHNFDAHPVCAQLPDTVHDSVHPGHNLTYLFPRDPVACGACGLACDGWRYRCAYGCRGADFHLQCLRGPGVGDVGVQARCMALEWITSRSVNGQGGNGAEIRKTKMDVIYSIFTFGASIGNFFGFFTFLLDLFG